MKIRKITIAVFLTAVMCLLFAACGAQTPSGECTAAPVQSTEEEKAETSSAAESTSAETIPEVTESETADAPADIHETGLPVLEILIDESQGTIDAMNQDPEHETKCTGEMRIDIPAGYRSEYEDKVYGEAVSETYELDYIRGRGNSTWGRDKKPYRIKLDKKADLLGMGEEKNWVLLANYYDCTMLRNKLTYRLGQEFFPEGTFVPQNVFVHVLMNGKYLGLYCLSENVRLGKERVPIEEPSYEEGASEEEISGGYLVTMEIQDDGGRVYHTARNTFQIDTPEIEDLTDRQLEYIQGFTQKVEDSICYPDQAEEGAICADLMDLDSYIDYFLIQEMSRNGDAYRTSSTYFYKDRGGKLVFGPLWDFDYVAWGGNLTSPEGFENVDYAPWMNLLLQDEAFRYRLSWRWGILKMLLEDMVKDGGWIDSYAAEIRDSQVLNYQAASTFLWEEPVLPGEGGGEDESQKEALTEGEIAERKQTYGFEQEVQRLKDWVKTRTEWLDANIREIRSEKHHVEFMDGEVMLQYLKLDLTEELTDMVPEPEKKAGYRFAGWYREENGEKLLLAEDDPVKLDQDTITYYAEWEPYDPAEDLLDLGFAQEVCYVDANSYLDVTTLVSTAPFDFDKEYLTMTVEGKPEDCFYPSDLAISFTGECEIRVTLSCGEKKASCKIIALGEEKLVLPKAYSLPGDLRIQAGVYGFVPLTPADGAMMVVSSGYERPVFSVEDTSIAEIDENGFLHGIRAGTTTITVEDPATGQRWSAELTVS